MDEKILNDLKAVVFPELDSGRGSFDLDHTEKALEYSYIYEKRILGYKVDWLVLRISVIAHDWGYYKLFEEKDRSSLNEIAKRKELHMELGAKKLKRLLNNRKFSNLSVSQKTRAVMLVKIHDKLNILKQDDELILMELDTLGGLSISRIPRYYEIVKEYRLPRFVTNYGKQECLRLLQLK